MKTELILSAAAITAACGAPPAASAPEPSTAPVLIATPEPEPVPTTSSASPPEPEAQVPELVEPTSVACRASARDWSYRRLRLSAKGEPFASVSGAPATLVFGADAPPERSLAVLDDGQVLLRLALSAAETPIYTKTPTPLAGVLIPEALTRLTWLGGAPGKLRVGVDASGLLVAPSPLSDDLPCDAVGIQAADFDVRASITKRQKLPKRSVARAGAEIAATPGGEARAQLRAGIGVEVLGTSGKATRVLIEGGGYWLVGWVASADLSTQASLLGVGQGFGAGRGVMAGNERAIVCSEDVPLWGEVGEERARIGVVHPGTGFKLLKSAEDGSELDPKGASGWVGIKLLVSWIWLEKDARFLVDGAAIQRCGVSQVRY